MNRLIYLLSILTVLAASCGQAKQKEQLTELQSSNDSLVLEKVNRDSTMTDVLTAFEAIDSNFRAIEKHKTNIAARVKQKRNKNRVKRDILIEIDAMDSLLKQNMVLIEDMIQNTGGESAEAQLFKRLFDMLFSKAKEEDQKVAVIRGELNSLGGDFAQLFEDYVNAEKEKWDMADELNTAWFLMDTKKGMKQKDLVDKKMLFSSDKLSKDFDRNLFQKINIQDISSIPIQKSEAKLITNHPSGSYELKMENNKVKELVITDPKAFWSISKYLLVEIGN